MTPCEEMETEKTALIFLREKIQCGSKETKAALHNLHQLLCLAEILNGGDFANASPSKVNGNWPVTIQHSVQRMRPHLWILEEKTDIAWGLYLVSSDGRGGHPLTVGQNVKDYLCSIIPWPIRWQEYDTVQMILGILGHRQRVSSSPAPVAGI